MRLRLAYWQAVAQRETGTRLSLSRWARQAGMSEVSIRVAKHRGRLGMYLAGKLSEALSAELGRRVYWWELYDPRDNPALDTIRGIEARERGEK